MTFNKIVSIVALMALASCQREKAVTAASKFENFSKDFNASGATAVIPDYSEAFFNADLAHTREQLQKLMAIDTVQLSFDERIDWRFAHSILKGQEIRKDQHRTWQFDPRSYMSFRALGNSLERPGPASEKVERLSTQLMAIPEQLENGRHQLQFYVPRFQELSLFMAENARSLFETDLMEFANQKDGHRKLIPLITRAEKSLEAFTTFLSEALPKRPKRDFAMGKETYNQVLKHQFLLDYDDETLWKFGKAQFEKTLAELTALAKEIDSSKTWQQLAVEIKNEYPEPDKMIAAHQLWVDSAKAHILRHKLIPIPWKEKVEVVPRAEYLRKTSYYGNFDRARGKDADSTFTAKWMINPFEDQWDDQTKQEYLNEHDWGVIIVTAPHEAYGGHHVQGLYQMHNPSRLRRENGISLFSEGWGLYNEQLMAETGFFPDKRIHLRQLQLRLWRNARVIYDVGIHTGKMTYEEAVALMTEKVGFLPWAAQLEIDSASERPGYFIGYFIGMSEILKMRSQYRKKTGSGFSLGSFHEALLKIGNMPPKLMATCLFRN